MNPRETRTYIVWWRWERDSAAGLHTASKDFESPRAIDATSHEEAAQKALEPVASPQHYSQLLVHEATNGNVMSFGNSARIFNIVEIPPKPQPREFKVERAA